MNTKFKYVNTINKEKGRSISSGQAMIFSYTPSSNYGDYKVAAGRGAKSTKLSSKLRLEKAFRETDEKCLTPDY